jgi:glycosyltransferase involved in cell wall biosynthesis
VVTLTDPDRVIEREGLGVAASAPAGIAEAVLRLLADPAAWKAASDRCREYVDREYGDEKILSAYLETFEKVLRRPASGRMIASPVRHV